MLVEKKEEAKVNELIEAIQSRGITIGTLKGKSKSQSALLDLANLEPCHPAASGKRVHIVDNCLVWPVMILYPECGETDFIQEFHEDST